jgi:23S rRNA (uracil1939-C5)-methyltransferase
MAEDQTVIVEFLQLVHGGDAMGRLPDGRALFVPYVLPGERAAIRLTEQKKGFARGALVDLLQASPERITDPSAADGSCAGCDYMHMAYPAQLRAKAAILRDQLQRIAGIPEPPVGDTVPSPLEWNYRNTVQFHLDSAGRLGFQAPGSHRVIPIQDCRLCDPVINEALPLLDFSGMASEGEGLARVQIRAGAEGDLLMVLESANPAPPEMNVEMPINIVFAGPGGLEENAPLVLSGDDHLVMEALGRHYRVSAGSFFQVNTRQAENMARHLLEHLPLQSTVRLLEVYAGVGLFSALLAPHVSELAAVESAPSAVEDFAANLDEFDTVALYDGLAEEVLPALDLHPDLVLVDPPRAGLALPALDALAAARAPFLAYISCDPATLARDAKRLLAAGYRLVRATPFDMFPQTHHIESISFFQMV